MTAHTHTQLEEAIVHFANVETLHQNGNLKAGVNKNDYITRSYMLHTLSALQEGNVYMLQTWVSVSASIVFNDTINPRDSLLKRFFDQLCRFAYDENMKLHGKYNDEQDDGAIAFQMFIYWVKVVITSSTVEYYQRLVHGLL
jgi:hypothetical protein